MADYKLPVSAIDGNNNIKGEKIERKTKKKFSVKGFFNGFIGKSGSSQISLDGLGVEQKKKKKKQGSMPNLISVQKFQETDLNFHRKLDYTYSVPSSLNLPRSRHIRPVLSTNSLNKADVNEDWLKPVRQQSDSSLSEVGTPREQRIVDMFKQPNMRRRPSYLSKNPFGSIDEMSDNYQHNDGLSNGSVRKPLNDYNNGLMKRSYSAANELRDSSTKPKNIHREISDGIIYERTKTNPLRESFMNTQSLRSLVHVGSFVCSVESSPSLGVTSPLRTRESSNQTLFRTASDAVLNTKRPVMSDKNVSQNNESITVQIDQEKMFGKKNKQRQKWTSVVDKRANDIEKTQTSPSESKNKTLKNNSDDDVTVIPISPSEERHSKLIKTMSTSSDVLEESFTSSFWDDTHVMLSNEKLREVSENETAQVLLDHYYSENEIKDWAKQISGNIREKIRAYTGRHFKIVVNTFIGGLLHSNYDTVNMTVRGLTEPKDDRFVVCAFEKNDMFVSVTCVLIKLR